MRRSTAAQGETLANPDLQTSWVSCQHDSLALQATYLTLGQ